MDASGAMKPYIPDRIVGVLITLGYTASVGVALDAQQQLSKLMPSHHTPIGLTTAVLATISFAAQYWTAYGVFRSQRWAFIFLALLELSRLANFVGNFWSLSPAVRSGSGKYLIVIPAGTALSIGALAYGIVRAAGLFGPPLPVESTPRPTRLDRLVGMAMILGSVAAGIFELGSVYQWTHGPDAIRYSVDEPLLSKLNPYNTTLVWRVTTVWISESVFKGHRWAFVLAAILALAVLLPLLFGSHQLHPAAVACYLAVLGYCGFRSWTTRYQPDPTQ